MDYITDETDEKLRLLVLASVKESEEFRRGIDAVMSLLPGGGGWQWIAQSQKHRTAWITENKLKPLNEDGPSKIVPLRMSELLLEFYLVNADGSPCKGELEQLPGYRELFSMIGQYRIEEPKNYGENGGIKCDVDEGPCACGAWH